MTADGGRTCGKQGCQRTAGPSGLCKTHYNKAYRLQTGKSRTLRPDPLPIEPIDPTEEWLPIPGFEGSYRVSSLGRVESIRRKGAPGGLIGIHVANTGYPTVSLVQNNKHVMRPVHVLIAAAFLGARPPEMEVRHLDGNKLNCVLSNLAYGTRSENVRDRVRHGTHNNANKTHCPQGHPYDETNTCLSKGKRSCLACRRDAYCRKRSAHAEARAVVPDGFLAVADLAELLGVKPATVAFIRTHSKPGGRYASDPFPTPDRTIARTPVWLAGRADEIKAWNARRPGQGRGGGQPSHRKAPE